MSSVPFPVSSKSSFSPATRTGIAEWATPLPLTAGLDLAAIERSEGKGSRKLKGLPVTGALNSDLTCVETAYRQARKNVGIPYTQALRASNSAAQKYT